MKAQGKIDKALGFSKPPKPPKFPMKFKEFLRRAFGGRYYGDRLHLYRKYLLDQFTKWEAVDWMYPKPGEKDNRPAHKRVDDFIAKISREGVGDRVRCFEILDEIQGWRRSNRIRQRRAANASRRLKENRKKILALLQHRISALSQSEKCSLAFMKRKKGAVSHLKR